MNHQTPAQFLERLRKPSSIYSAAPAIAVKSVCALIVAITLTLLGMDALKVRMQLTDVLPPPPKSDLPGQTIKVPAAISLQELGAMNLTGIPATPPTQVVPAPTPEPRTEIRLVGTITDSQSQLASALISVGGQPAKRVFVGEAITDEMTLKAVFDNRAEYSYADSELTLHFPFSDIRDVPQMQNRQRRQMELQRPSASGSNQDAEDEVNEAREKLQRFRARKGNNEN